MIVLFAFNSLEVTHLSLEFYRAPWSTEIEKKQKINVASSDVAGLANAP